MAPPKKPPVEYGPDLVDLMLDSCLHASSTHHVTQHHVDPLALTSAHDMTYPAYADVFREPVVKEGRVVKRKTKRAPAKPWSKEEHEKFEQALEMFGRNWGECARYIGTRPAPLVRSHAQKYLIKLWKTGKPLPKKVAESGKGYTLSGKPLLPESASARSYLTKIPCPPDSSSPSKHLDNRHSPAYKQ